MVGQDRMVEKSRFSYINFSISLSKIFITILFRIDKDSLFI